MVWECLLLALCGSVASVLAGRQLIHWFQLESYQFPGFYRTLKRNGFKALIPGICLAVSGMAVLRLMSGCVPTVRAAVTGAVLIGLAFLLRWAGKRVPAKKPMVATSRMKRLHAVTMITVLVPLFFLLKITSMSFMAPGFFVFLPGWIALGGLLAWPIEKAISELYFRDAQRILRERPDMIRIGITGSWGKTSVKFILGTLLQEKYNTLVTPSSFNTPMGVTKVIRTQLEPGHRVFVAEMGARHVGDIKEMCRLVHPHMGLLTSVGPQHLDTFRTVERVAKTKYELMDAIPEGGSCFFADDGGIVLDLYRKTEKDKMLTGLDPERDDVWAEEIRVSPSGSEFILCMDGERIACRTELLGELNIRNIVLCAGACRKLGMNGREIARGIARLKPVEHRLQLVRHPGGLTVIDDAFNSNIRGAEQAFRVLKEFPGKRIVVTPGMVELGDREEEMNREFGRKMSECCDLAVLVGRNRSAAIAAGLTESGFPEENIRRVDSLAEATELLKTVSGAGDTVLFENDLPDNYG